MEEDELISFYTSSRDPGVPLIYNHPGNPFLLDDCDQSVFLTSCDPLSPNSSRTSISRLSLVDRSKMATPRIGPCTTRATKLRKSENYHAPVKGREPVPRTRTMTMNEYMVQKREIYITQLSIDKKKRRIGRINGKIDNENFKSKVKEIELERDEDFIKKKTTECELSLSNWRKTAEQAARKRIELTVQVKAKELNNSILRTENEKLEEPIEQYNRFKEFLEYIAPKGVKDPLSYFTDPKRLINEITMIETETLGLIQQYNRINEMLERALENGDTIPDISEEIPQNILDLIKIQHQENEKFRRIPGDVDDHTQELENICKLVDDTYEDIFQPNEVMSAMEKLEKIESRLVEMEMLTSNMDPKFINYMNRKLNMGKKETLRKQKLQVLLSEREKNPRSVRSNKIVIKGNQRQLKQRMLPHRAKKDMTAIIERAERERLRSERLLFGEDD